MRNVAYQYDPVGNRQQVTDSGTGVSPVWYTANNLNQYTIVGGNNLSYDTKGNLQTIPGWTYQYDAQNRLLSVSSVSSVVQFSYDARNRCVARTVNGVTTRFVYDGWSLLEERNASGTEQARYYHGAMIDELLLRITANTYYYHHDGLGSTIALTDSTGALAESYTYDVFGAATIMATNAQLFAASSVGNRFLFTGREYLADIGLYDYRNRFYSPWLGRFLQTDPIRFDAGDVSLYRCVRNLIANLIDSFGLESQIVSSILISPQGPYWGEPTTGGGGSPPVVGPRYSPTASIPSPVYDNPTKAAGGLAGLFIQTMQFLDQIGVTRSCQPPVFVIPILSDEEKESIRDRNMVTITSLGGTTKVPYVPPPPTPMIWIKTSGGVTRIPFHP
jgi:RHS repeat-associated protein